MTTTDHGVVLKIVTSRGGIWCQACHRVIPQGGQWASVGGWQGCPGCVPGPSEMRAAIERARRAT